VNQRMIRKLIHWPVTPALRAWAATHPKDADEAVLLVTHGLRGAHPNSWVAEKLRSYRGEES
jgi:hypothetical protein